MKKEIDWEPFRNQEDALSSLGRRNKEWCVLSHPMEIQNRFPHSYPFPLSLFLSMRSTKNVLSWMDRRLFMLGGSLVFRLCRTMCGVGFFILIYDSVASLVDSVASLVDSVASLVDSEASLVDSVASPVTENVPHAQYFCILFFQIPPTIENSANAPSLLSHPIPHPHFSPHQSIKFSFSLL